MRSVSLPSHVCEELPTNILRKTRSQIVLRHSQMVVELFEMEFSTQRYPC